MPNIKLTQVREVYYPGEKATNISLTSLASKPTNNVWAKYKPLYEYEDTVSNTLTDKAYYVKGTRIPYFTSLSQLTLQNGVWSFDTSQSRGFSLKNYELYDSTSCYDISEDHIIQNNWMYATLESSSGKNEPYFNSMFKNDTYIRVKIPFNSNCLKSNVNVPISQNLLYPLDFTDTVLGSKLIPGIVLQDSQKNFFVGLHYPDINIYEESFHANNFGKYEMYFPASCRSVGDESTFVRIVDGVCTMWFVFFVDSVPQGVYTLNEKYRNLGEFCYVKNTSFPEHKMITANIPAFNVTFTGTYYDV